MPENISEIKAERVTETLVVYQQKGVFSFGTDAMLLADYVSEQQSAAGAKKLCDLCSGTGILSLVLCDRFPGLAAEAIEINPAAARLSEKSAGGKAVLPNAFTRRALISKMSARFSIANRSILWSAIRHICGPTAVSTANTP